MFGWFKKKSVAENVINDPPKMEVVRIDNYEKDRAWFEEKYKETIEKYEKRKHTDSKFRENDIVKTIYPNSPEMLVSFVKCFNYSITSNSSRQIFETENKITYIIDYAISFSVNEPEICVKYHDSNFQLVVGKFKEEELIIVSRKEV